MTEAPHDIRTKIASVKHWYHQIEVAPGVITPGVNDSRAVLAHLDLPASCAGLRVLDLGARDGFFSFELERRGAEVLALDYVSSDQSGFKVASELLGSKVTYVQDNIYKVTPERYGTFDVVMFLGLLYHLPDPLGALHIVRSVCRAALHLETQVIDNAFRLASGEFVPLKAVSKQLDGIPIMQFYPDVSLHGDPTNYWAPNLACLEQMLAETNFSITTRKLLGARAIVQCRAIEDARREYFMGIARGSRAPG
jgi:tRNA (mo5U34)-methyltransferase